MNIKDLFAYHHVSSKKLDVLLQLAEDVKTDVERAIADGEEFKDSDYRLLEDNFMRAMINIEDAADLFFRRWYRKTPRSRKMVVKPIEMWGSKPSVAVQAKP
jgi:hypothetical protein